MKLLFAAFVISLTMSSCFTMVQVSGTGASHSIKVQKKEWFALWGLVHLNKIDAKELTGGAKNYTVKTQFQFDDLFLNVLTFVFSIGHRTVTVVK